MNIFPILASCVAFATMQYPDTERVVQIDNYHGTKVADPYRWLEDSSDTSVNEWIDAQNKVTSTYLENIPYREALGKRVQELLSITVEGVPMQFGAYTFTWRAEAEGDQPLLYVEKKGEDRRLLLDVNKLSSDGTVSVSAIYPSWDGKRIALMVAESGSDWKMIRVIDSETGFDVETPIEWVKFSQVAWDQEGFFYCKYDKPQEGKEFTGVMSAQRVYYHKLNTRLSQDALIYSDDKRPKMMYHVETTEDQNYLILTMAENWTKNAIYVKPLKANKGFISAIPSFEANNRPIDVIDDTLYVHTNQHAPMGRVVKIDLKNCHCLTEVIPEQKNRLSQVAIFNNRFVVHYLEDVASKLDVYSLKGEKIDQISTPKMGQISGLHGLRNARDFCYKFTSYMQPSTVYKYSFTQERSHVVYEPEFPINLANFEAKRIFYYSKDGTRVPMFILQKKGMKPEPKPTLLYAYGGFDISVMPSFSPQLFALLEQGCVVAIANIRGGGEYGDKWHNAGNLLNKQNGFDDFIAAAEYLFAQKITSPDKLAINGRSNGGLLVGAVSTQRPDICKVALPGVGVLDMLRFHLFTIGWSWVREYGSSDDPKDFANLYSYSPYHNVKEGVAYPATLVTTADHDDRVVPAHSFKYVSALQHSGAKKNPYLIRIEKKAGHGTGMARSQRVHLYRDEYAFMLCNMNVKYSAPVHNHRDASAK